MVRKAFYLTPFLALVLAMPAQATLPPLAVLTHRPADLLMMPDGRIVYTAMAPDALGTPYVSAMICLDAQGGQVWAHALPPSNEYPVVFSAQPDGGVTYLGSMPFLRYYVLDIDAQGMQCSLRLLPEGSAFPSAMDGWVFYTRYADLMYPVYQTKQYEGIWKLPPQGEALSFSLPDAPDITGITRLQRLGDELYTLVTNDRFAAILLRLDDDMRILWRHEPQPGQAINNVAWTANGSGGVVLSWRTADANPSTRICSLDGQGRQLWSAQLAHPQAEDISIHHITRAAHGNYLLLGSARQAGPPFQRYPFELSLDEAGQITDSRFWPEGVLLFPGQEGTIACLQDPGGLFEAVDEISYGPDAWYLTQARHLEGLAMPPFAMLPAEKEVKTS